MARGQTSAVVVLPRFAFVPVPATAANLQQTTFNFTDGAVFGLADIQITLATGTFTGDVGDFALTASGSMASGSVTIGSCTFVVTTSSFPSGQGLQVDDNIVIDPCQVDAIDRRLIVTNISVSVTPTISSTPLVYPSGYNSESSAPSHADYYRGYPWYLPDCDIREQPLGHHHPGHHGPPGARNGQPHECRIGDLPTRGNFNGTDSLVVTVVVIFTDNSSPALLLGTVPISIIVQPWVTPRAHGPSINTSQNTPGTVQIGVNDPDAGQRRRLVSVSPWPMVSRP